VAASVVASRRRTLPACLLPLLATVDPDTGAPKGGWFTPGQMKAMPDFVGLSMVTAGTTLDYERGWTLWRRWLRSLDANRRPDEYLELVQDDEDKARLVLLFAMSLYAEKAWRGRQITRLFAHIAHFIRIRFVPITFFKHPIVGAARLAVRHSPAEMRVHLTAKSKAALAPMCLEMLDYAREVLWVQQSRVSAQGLDARAAYVAMALLVDTGKRVSSVTGPTFRKGVLVADHGIIWSDVEVLTTRTEGEGTTLRAGGRSLRQYLGSQPEPTVEGQRRYPGVSGFTIKFFTEKVRVPEDRAQVDAIPFGRTNERENQFLEDIMDWARLSGDVEEGDYVCTRIHPDPRPGVLAGRRLLRRADVASAVKMSADAVGLDPAKFSTSSARKCFATFTTANGMLADERNRRAGWVQGSRTVDDHYNKLVHNRGVFALGGEAFTLREVGRLTQVVVTDHSAAVVVVAPRGDVHLPVSAPLSDAAPPQGPVEASEEAPEDDDDDLQCLLSGLSDIAFGYEGRDGVYLVPDLGDLDMLGAEVDQDDFADDLGEEF
jgi:hypothetical protein